MTIIKPLLATWLVLSTAPALASEPIDETRPLASDELLMVSNVSGEIEIEAWGKNEVEITGELGRRSTLDITKSSRGLRIEVKPENGNWGSNGPGDTYLQIRAPGDARLEISGVSASIRIDGFDSRGIEAETVSGDIEVMADADRLELIAVSGDVEFSGNARRTTAETVSGDITLKGVSGELEVSMVSGDLELSGDVFSRGQFESVSGNLELHLTLDSGARMTVESMSGDVTVYLPSDQEAEFTAQSFSGKVRSKFGQAERVKNGPGTQLNYISGDGSAQIRLESFSGDIDIRNH